MGTRGAIGMRRYRRDKITYNHYDSYPSGIGIDVFKTVRQHSDEELIETYGRIRLVQEDDRPTPAQIERYRKFADENVSTHSLTEWYVLLRTTQGTLEPYVRGEVDHMIDMHHFLTDSLFCEWAYVINLDTRKVEVHRGFNQDPKAPGRYAKRDSGVVGGSSGARYYGVRLLTAINFDIIRSTSEFELNTLMDGLEKQAYEQEGE